MSSLTSFSVASYFFFFNLSKKTLRIATIRDLGNVPRYPWCNAEEWHVVLMCTVSEETFRQARVLPNLQLWLLPFTCCCLGRLTCANCDSISCLSRSSILCCLWMSTVAPIPTLASLVGSEDEKRGSRVQAQNLAIQLGTYSTSWTCSILLL